MFQSTGRRLIWRRDAQTLWIEPWGENSLRVRATAEAAMPEMDWALLPAPEAEVEIAIGDGQASIVCGKLRAAVSAMAETAARTSSSLLPAGRFRG